MDEFMMKLLREKLIQMIADFNAIDRGKMYEFKCNSGEIVGNFVLI